MWISQKMRPAPSTVDADLGVTTIAGSNVGVVTRGEVRDLPVYGPRQVVCGCRKTDRQCW